MTTTHDVKIRSGAGRAVIELDGVDVSNLVHAVRVDHEARALPEVDLTLAVTRYAVAAQARVRIDSASRDLLVALGWTPPRDEQ